MTDDLVERLTKAAERCQAVADGNEVGNLPKVIQMAYYRLSEAAARINSDADTIASLRRERDEARQIVRDIYWMALRYADGRKSYAVGMCNDAVQKAYDGGWITPKDQGGDPITPHLARDGMAAEWIDISARAHAAEAQVAKLTDALSEGLDLCARARKMDEMEKERAERYLREPELTRSATIPVWAEEQYQRDLAAWETKAKVLMPFPFAALQKDET